MSNEQNILEKKCILKQNEPKKSHYYSIFLYNLQALRQKDRPILSKISSSSFRNEGVRENGVFLNF